MKNILTTMALASVLSVPAFAQSEPAEGGAESGMPVDPPCTEYMSMGADGQMQLMDAMNPSAEQDREKVAEGGAEKADVLDMRAMQVKDLATKGAEACTIHPEGTVGQALTMMEAG